MKKFFLILFVIVLVVGAVFAYMLLTPGESRAKWLTVRFSETLKEKNELLTAMEEAKQRLEIAFGILE